MPSGLNNNLSGGAGNDKLFGDAGSDRMIGGLGNDDFFVTDAGDVTVELAGQGNDRVVTTVTHTLGANIETLRMIGAADIVGTGNAQNNTIIGNTGDNWLVGQDGNDVLNGTAGGDNKFVGGEEGIDYSYGGAGRDVFIFADGWDSDRIYNFQTGPGADRVSLALVTNITSYADLQANHLTTDAFGNALIYDGTDAIRLMGIAEAALTVDNFLF